MGCNCGKRSGVDELRVVTFADGTTVLADTEAEARGEISAHGGGTWQTLRGAAATAARAEHEMRLRSTT